jgi:hypothetical protein
MPVYTIDGKKIGFLRKVHSDYMVIKSGFILLRKYFIPTSLAESVTGKDRIRLNISNYDAQTKYSTYKIKQFISAFEYLPESEIKQRPLYDRLESLRYSATRNRIAAIIAFTSGLLFLLSGYKANIEIYKIIAQDIAVYTPRELLNLVILPIGVLALISQLGGLAVLMGAGFFAANRINLGKFLIAIGTGQGLFTVLIRIALEIWSGRFGQLGSSGLQNNYITWLTSTATGLGILFAIIAPSIAKGRGESIASKIFKFIIKRKKKSEWQ